MTLREGLCGVLEVKVSQECSTLLAREAGPNANNSWWISRHQSLRYSTQHFPQDWIPSTMYHSTMFTKAHLALGTYARFSGVMFFDTHRDRVLSQVKHDSLHSRPSLQLSIRDPLHLHVLSTIHLGHTLDAPTCSHTSSGKRIVILRDTACPIIVSLGDMGRFEAQAGGYLWWKRVRWHEYSKPCKSTGK